MSPDRPTPNGIQRCQSSVFDSPTALTSVDRHPVTRPDRLLEHRRRRGDGRCFHPGHTSVSMATVFCPLAAMKRARWWPSVLPSGGQVLAHAGDRRATDNASEVSVCLADRPMIWAPGARRSCRARSKLNASRGPGSNRQESSRTFVSPGASTATSLWQWLLFALD